MNIHFLFARRKGNSPRITLSASICLNEQNDSDGMPSCQQRLCADVHMIPPDKCLLPHGNAAADSIKNLLAEKFKNECDQLAQLNADLAQANDRGYQIVA